MMINSQLVCAFDDVHKRRPGMAMRSSRLTGAKRDLHHGHGGVLAVIASRIGHKQHCQTEYRPASVSTIPAPLLCTVLVFRDRLSLRTPLGGPRAGFWPAPGRRWPGPC